jgi:Domain of unknown function (DUF4861)
MNSRLGTVGLIFGALTALVTFVACGYCFARAQSHGGAKIVEVTNTTDVARPESVIELDLAEVQANAGIRDARHIVVEDQATHRALLTQLYSSAGSAAPDRLLVLVNVGAKKTIALAIHEAQGEAAAKPMVYGRLVPERKDDFAWENDKVAYRVYGPALQATGEMSSGIDVWSKRVPALIVDEWYKRDAEGARTKNPALSYHKDDGTGLDSYDVGKTRGCGGTAVWSDGKLFVSKNFTSARILASGPIRFSFELEYAPWNAEGANVSEKKTITLDAGSHLNKIESTFTFAGLQAIKIAVGVGTHAGALESSPVEGRILCVWEPLSDPGAGNDGTAVALQPGHEAGIAKAEGNAFFVLNANSGKPLNYFAGAGWSRSDIPTQKAWVEYLRAFLVEQEHPLEIHWR